MKKTILASILCALITPAFAADITVPGDQPTIADAIAAAAASGDRILLTQDTVSYPIDTIQINKSLLIEGAPGISPVLAIANGAPRGFRLGSGFNLELRNLTIDGSANQNNKDFPATVDPQAPSLVLQGVNTLVVDNVTFLNATARAIDARTVAGPLNITVTNTTFDGAGNRAVQINDISGGTSVITFADCTFTRVWDDALAVRNGGTWDLTIERCTFHTPADQIDADAIQVGGNTGTVVTVRDCVVYNWGDDAVQLESPQAATFNINSNTFWNVGTPVNQDSPTFSGTVNFTQNIVAEWNQGKTGSDTAQGQALFKGFAIADTDAHASATTTWTISSNVFFDAQDSQYFFGSRAAATTGSDNLTGTNIASLFVSLDPLSADFLRRNPAGPAVNVQSLGLDAGANSFTNVSDWSMY